MRGSRLALVVLLGSLVVTSCGQVRPKLVPERSQVWHWPRDRTQREVETTTRARQGDRVWTEEHGRALLKWPDLWVRLYDDTQLHVETCGVASDVCLAMGLGTALNGGVSSVKQRITWTTSQAEISLVGTMVMVSYHAETQFTIVRVFDGVVVARNLMGEMQTASVEAGEWALVEPGRPPQVSDRLEEMRGLARELGLWDMFHEVEQDVAEGFGPADGRVPPEDVEILFVEPPLAPTPTNTNTPMNTPLPATSTLAPKGALTNTPFPPTALDAATNTPTKAPLPPSTTPTDTPSPPTATDTALPPTATDTAPPPTATDTPFPPTATGTPFLPTATPTLSVAGGRS